MNENMQYQCHLRRGSWETTGWIPARAAKKGARVQVLPAGHFWEVLSVGVGLPEHLLKEHQKMNRKSLLSVEPTGAPSKKVGRI